MIPLEALRLMAYLLARNRNDGLKTVCMATAVTRTFALTIVRVPQTRPKMARGAHRAMASPSPLPIRTDHVLASMLVKVIDAS